MPGTATTYTDSGLSIPHAVVSRQHCEIFEAGDEVRVRDLGSTNGTTVDGKRIAEVALRPHDYFEIGPYTFTVEFEAKPRALPARLLRLRIAWRERRADLYALRTTRNGPALASAFTRLANQNLADADPEPWVEFLLYSHPALSKRIAMARSASAQGSPIPEE